MLGANIVLLIRFCLVPARMIQPIGFQYCNVLPMVKENTTKRSFLRQTTSMFCFFGFFISIYETDTCSFWQLVDSYL